MPPRLGVVRLVPVLDFGGVESNCVIWARLLPRERYDARICTFAGAGKAAADIRREGVPVDVLDVDPSVRNPRATRALFRYLRDRRPDVLHASIAEANFHGVIAGRAARVSRILLEETGIPGRSLLGRAAFGACFRAADVAIGVSEATCDYLRAEEWVPSDRVALVYNTIDPRFFAPLAREAPSSDRVRVLAIGRYDPVKNFDGLLRAFRGVVDVFPGATLEIAGDGPARAELDALRRDLGLEGHVELLGFRSDVRELHARADLFVLPSHSEGFGLALLEAMASGLPVLTTRRGGSAEVAADLGEDVLLDPEDGASWTSAMLRIARLSPANRLAEGARARAAATRRFSPSTYIDALDALYVGPGSRSSR